jgi:hypothetical protein
MEQPGRPTDYVSVVDVDVASVTPERAGFILEGRGADRSDYRLSLDLEVPLDVRTRSVLGEMLSQCKIRVWRRTPSPKKSKDATGRFGRLEPRAPAE